MGGGGAGGRWEEEEQEGATVRDSLPEEAAEAARLRRRRPRHAVWALLCGQVIKDYPKYYDDILDKAMERLENTLRSNASMVHLAAPARPVRPDPAFLSAPSLGRHARFEAPPPALSSHLGLEPDVTRVLMEEATSLAHRRSCGCSSWTSRPTFCATKSSSSSARAALRRRASASAGTRDLPPLPPRPPSPFR